MALRVLRLPRLVVVLHQLQVEEAPLVPRLRPEGGALPECATKVSESWLNTHDLQITIGPMKMHDNLRSSATARRSFDRCYIQAELAMGIPTALAARTSEAVLRLDRISSMTSSSSACTTHSPHCQRPVDCVYLI